MSDETMSEDDQQYQDSLPPCLCKGAPEFQHLTAEELDDGGEGDVWSIWHRCDDLVEQCIYAGSYSTAEAARDVWSKMVSPKQGDTAQLLARAKEVDDLQARVRELGVALERIGATADAVGDVDPLLAEAITDGCALMA